ncbi:MAG: murein biosynthesis integral membrane protein MurJ [Thermodesulfobacteriota bacterium]
MSTPNNRENEKITKAAGIVGSATLLSRVLGLVRDQVTAYFFGAGLVADAFFVAFRIPNLLRRLLAEGALTVSFIPIFTEYLTTRSREDAFRVFRASLTLFTLVLILVTVLGVAASPWIIRVFAPGFYDEPEKFALTVYLTRIMFPYIFIAGLMALIMGGLNSLDRFAAPALSPVMLNLGIIASVLVLMRFFDPPVLALAIGVLVGGVLQLLIQLPSLMKQKGLLGVSFQFDHPAIKRICLLMGPAALGAAVYQFSVFINTLLASFLPEGSVSFLYYADRLMQFPLGVFAVAIGTAVLPSMSRQAADHDLEGLRQTLSFSLRLIFFITIPATLGLIVLSEPLLQLLFQRGRFGPDSTQATAGALIAYALGLTALSSVQVLVRAFYSLKDTKTPAQIGSISLLISTGLAAALMGPFKHVGLALASSAASIINFVWLLILLRRRLGRIDGRIVIKALLQDVLWSLIMALVVWLVVRDLDPKVAISTVHLAVRVLGAGALGLGVYTALAWWGRAPETAKIRAILNRRRRPGKQN